MKHLLLISLVATWLVGCAEKAAPFRIPAACPMDRLGTGDWGVAAPRDPSRLWVAANDKALQSGLLRRIDLARREVSPRAGYAPADAVVRAPSGAKAVFVVGRFRADNITVEDAVTMESLCQFSVGRGTNPYDVVVWRGIAYVSRYQASSILKFDLAAGSAVGEIDLRSLADADGKPEMTSLALEGDELLVQVQRLDETKGFEVEATSPMGLVARIDLETERILETVELPFQNPGTGFRSGPGGELYLGLTGAHGKQDGGVVTLGKRVVVRERDLGGDILELAVGSRRAFALVVTSDGRSRVVAFDPVTGRVEAEFIAEQTGVSYQSLSTLILDDRNGRLYVADRGLGSPGVREYDVSGGGSRFVGKIGVGLLPSFLSLGD